MKLKVQHVMDSTLVLAAIINERRPMPQKGKYRVARLHAKLLPEFQSANGQRDEMIKAYEMPQTQIEKTEEHPLGIEVPTDGWQVPADKMPEFTAAWKVIADEEIEVDVEPIPLGYLSLGDQTDGAIESTELITLGELVTE